MLPLLQFQPLLVSFVGEAPTLAGKREQPFDHLPQLHLLSAVGY